VALKKYINWSEIAFLKGLTKIQQVPLARSKNSNACSQLDMQSTHGLNADHAIFDGISRTMS